MVHSESNDGVAYAELRHVGGGVSPRSGPPSGGEDRWTMDPTLLETSELPTDVSNPLRVAFVSAVPSQYQRDLFAALAMRPEVKLGVYYMERAAPDSPWAHPTLQGYERYLPGFCIPFRQTRIHFNWRLPRPRDYDVVVCNTLTSFTGQWLMRYKLRRTPWMFWGEKLGRRSRRHDRLTAPLRRTKGIVAVGSWAEADYARRFPGVPVFNIPYHCALEAFRKESRPPRDNGTVTFLFCGQMISRKGVDHLLTAFGRLPEHTRLLLVGREAELPGLLPRLPLKVRERITYAGFQPPDALPGFFARADVFVLPSRYDGWGVVVNQALGAGLPILLSDQVGAAYDLLAAGENGDWFEADDPLELQAKMMQFAWDPELCERWGATSRERSNDWDPEDGAERWVQALRKVCGANIAS